MKILSIEHVQIAMPAGEEEQARKFYINLLGFSETPKPPELAKRFGIDITKRKFWDDSLAIIGKRIDRYIEL